MFILYFLKKKGLTLFAFMGVVGGGLRRLQEALPGPGRTCAYNIAAFTSLCPVVTLRYYLEEGSYGRPTTVRRKSNG
jgi:hypothetical protein